MRLEHDPVKAAGNLKKHGVSFADAEGVLCDPLARRSERTMRPEYDFSKGKRGAVIPQKGKTRISIFIDNAVLAEFRVRAEKLGAGYQTMMNEALRAYLAEAEQPITEKVLRHVLRQEMPEYLRGLTTPSSGAKKTAGRGGAPRK